MIERRSRDLAMFNLAIDSKVRSCDVVALKVEDVAPNGYAIDRAAIRQRKTGRPVKFELTLLPPLRLCARAADRHVARRERPVLLGNLERDV